MHQVQALAIILLFSLSAVYGEKVLVFPVDGSHWLNMKVIIEALHSRGHSVSVLKPADSWYIKESSSFYTTIPIDMGGGFDENFISTFVSRLLEIQRGGRSTWACFKMEMEIMEKSREMAENMANMIAHMLENQEFMQSLRDAEYDLFLTDPAIGGEVFLAHSLGLPVVFNVRWVLTGEGHSAVAPTPLSYVPITATQLTDNMSFLQRVLNVLVYGMYQFQVAVYKKPYYTDLAHRFFGPDTDYLSLLQGADLWLMRVDFVFEFPRPTMPNVVYMGGFQCKPAKPLPPDLEDFVQSSGEHGVIIMSLGTLVGELPQDLADEIAAAFSQLPQKVIWRYKGRRPATLGNNTLIVDWMPQNDLLGHPQIKAFVAHGGTNGVQEALYHGVPLLGLPLIFDQHDNVKRIEVRGAGKTVDIFTMDREIFLQGLLEVLHEPSYRLNMQRLSKLHRDQPMKPLDSALFWIEYVMRHKGASHLRTESYKMPWYVYHSIDVIMFLLTVGIISMLICASVLRFFFRMCLKRKMKND